MVNCQLQQIFDLLLNVLNLFRRFEACYHLSEVYVNKNRWNNPPDPVDYALAGEYLSEGEIVAGGGNLPDMVRRAIPFRIRFMRQGGDIAAATAYCESMLNEASENDWLTRQQIFERGWGEEYAVADNNIMVCISKLRAKLSEDPSAYIRTIRGLGYRLER